MVAVWDKSIPAHGDRMKFDHSGIYSCTLCHHLPGAQVGRCPPRVHGWCAHHLLHLVSHMYSCCSDWRGLRQGIAKSLVTCIVLRSVPNVGPSVGDAKVSAAVELVIAFACSWKKRAEENHRLTCRVVGFQKTTLTKSHTNCPVQPKEQSLMRWGLLSEAVCHHFRPPTLPGGCPPMPCP